MIVNTSFRAPGGLARHLLRVDTNEAVRIRDDLSVGCALDVVDAVGDFAVLGRIRGVEKGLIHVSLSPERPLTPQQERQMIAHLRSVYAIPDDHPALVVAHEKPGETARPTHYHVVMPRLRTDGRRISDSYYKIRNERLSLELELEFAHSLTPGPNIAAVRRVLDVERPDIRAAIADLGPPPRGAAKTTVADKNAAVDAGLDIAAFDARVLDAWCAGTIPDADRLRTRGLALARGDKVVMVVDLTTGYSAPLRRLVNREAKRRGDPSISIKREADLSNLLDQTPLPPLKPSRRAFIATSAELQQQISRQARAIEDWVGGLGAMPTRQMRTSTRDGAEATSQTPEPPHRPDTVAAQLDTIRLHQRLILESRKRAAEEAWRKAKIWRSRSLKALVSLAAAGAAVACGSGLLVTIAAASLASRIAVARGRALADEARSASAAVKASREEMRAETREYFEKVALARAFRLDEIPPEARIAAGYLHRTLSDGDTPQPEILAAMNRCAPGLADRIAIVATHGSSPAVARILDGMFRPEEERARHALENFVSSATPRPWGAKKPARRTRGGRDR